MKRTLQELLNYAEKCMDTAATKPGHTEYWQRQCELATQLAHATALASAIHYRKQEVDLSE